MQTIKQLAEYAAYADMTDDTTYYGKQGALNYTGDNYREFWKHYYNYVDTMESYATGTMHGDQRDSDWHHYH